MSAPGVTAAGFRAGILALCGLMIGCSERDGREPGPAGGKPNASPALRRPDPIPPPPEPPPGTPDLSRYTYSTDQAIRLFETRVRKRPNDFLSYRYLGHLYQRKAGETGTLEYYEKADKALRSSLRIFPDHLATEAELAATLASRHRFAEALALARKVHGADPQSLHAMATINDALLELGRYDEAETTLNELNRISSAPQAISRRANLAELRGNTAEATRLMQQACDEANRSGGPKEAAWYRGRLGDLAFGAGRVGEAGRHYENVPKGVDSYHDATFGLARVRLAEGRKDEAVRLFKQAVVIGPDPHMLAALGDHYVSLGKPEAAKAMFDDFERRTAGRAEYRRERSLFLADHDRRLPEALALAQKDLAERKDIFGYDALAWALYKNDRVAEADEAMVQARKLGTQDARLFYHAGLIRRKLGDTKGAREILERALALNPHFSASQAEHARQVLGALPVR